MPDRLPTTPTPTMLALSYQALGPIMERVEAIARENGELRERVKTIARERDELRAEVRRLREIGETRHAEEDTDRFTPIPPVWEPQETSRTAPGATEAAAMGRDTSHRESWLSSALRRLIGRT